jgi:hypothetical protein
MLLSKLLLLHYHHITVEQYFNEIMKILLLLLIKIMITDEIDFIDFPCVVSQEK